MAIAEELKVVVSADVGRAVNDMNRFTGATEKTTSKLKALVVGIGATVASVYTLRKAFDFAKNAAQIGAQTDQIRMALDNMARRAGTTATDIVLKMQRMSGQTIDQLRIMESASKAALLGIPLERLDDLMQVARASATALGTDVGTMFDDLATGIGRQSKMILDNLGINISAEKAYKQYAETLGKTAEQLTDNERRQAFLNAVLADGKRIMEEVGEAGSKMTATEPWQIMTAAITDAKIAIGEKLFPLFNQGALKVAQMVRDMTSYLSNLPDTFEAVGNLIKIILKETFSWEMIKANVVDMAMGFFETWQKTVMLIPRLWWNTVKTIGNIFSNLGEWIISLFTNVWTRVRNLAVDKIGDLLSKIGIEIERKGIPPVLSLGDVWSEIIDDAGAGYAEMGKILWDTISTNLNTYGEMLENLAANYKDNPAFQEALAQLKAIREQAEAAATAVAGVAGGGVPTGEPPAPPAEVAEEYERAVIATDHLMNSLSMASEYASKAWEPGIVQVQKMEKELSKLEEYYGSLGEAAKAAYQDTFESLGESIAGMEDAWDSLGEIMKDIVAKGLEALGQDALVRAAAAFAAGFVNPKMFAAAAAWGTAAAMAFTGAGIVRGLAEGGIVTKPTAAVIGEAGPEAVIPLSKAGGALGVTQNFYIRGSMISYRELQRVAANGMLRIMRGC
jgi:hypothetical protein